MPPTAQQASVVQLPRPREARRAPVRPIEGRRVPGRRAAPALRLVPQHASDPGLAQASVASVAAGFAPSGGLAGGWTATGPGRAPGGNLLREVFGTARTLWRLLVFFALLVVVWLTNAAVRLEVADVERRIEVHQLAVEELRSTQSRLVAELRYRRGAQYQSAVREALDIGVRRPFVVGQEVRSTQTAAARGADAASGGGAAPPPPGAP